MRDPGGVLDRPGRRRPATAARRRGTPARRSGPVARRLFQPTTPTRVAGPDPGLAEDLRERPRPVAWLARQAQVLEQDALHRQGSGAGHPPALVADEHDRVAGRRDDEDRLLEARVEPGEVREVRAVLAVGVDDEPVVAGDVHPLAESLQPGRVERRPAAPARTSGMPEVGQVDRGQAGRSRRRRHRSTHSRAGLPRGRRRSRRARSSRSSFASTGIHGPTSPSGQVTRTSASVALAQPEMDPAELAAGVAAADRHLARRRAGRPTRTSTHAPIASWFGASWSSRRREPVAHRRGGCRRRPPPTFRQTWTVRRAG